MCAEKNWSFSSDSFGFWFSELSSGGMDDWGLGMTVKAGN